MASYLRSIFGSNSSTSRASTKDRDGGRSKSHGRSRSVPHSNSRSMSHVYAAYPSVAPSARGYSPSSQTKRPSPLRYDTYDSSTVSSKTRPTRPLELPSGTVSYQSGDTFFPYPIYTPALSTSSRTNSGSSLYATSSSGHGHGYSPSHGHRPPMTPRTSSSGSVPKRPALKQTHTWHATDSKSRTQAHVSFAASPKRSATLHMHPLFASSRYSRAPVSYDVLYPPCFRTVVDRNTRSAVPSHTLSQPATDPPTMTRFVLRSDKFPWPIVVESKPKSAAKFYLGETSPPATPASNLDVLNAIYHTLSQRATKEEWEALGHGSQAQRKISRAYDRRCRAFGGGWEDGICRIDWLGEKTRLIGIEGGSEAGVGKLIFAKP